MAADGHLGPSNDVEHSLYPFARRIDNFLGEPRVAKRRPDPLARVESKRLTGVLFVYAKRRCNVSGEPVDRDVRQQLIEVKPLGELISAVAPDEEFFKQPRVKSSRELRSATAASAMQMVKGVIFMTTSECIFVRSERSSDTDSHPHNEDI
jgi:hypothetical protein